MQGILRQSSSLLDVKEPQSFICLLCMVSRKELLQKKKLSVVVVWDDCKAEECHKITPCSISHVRDLRGAVYKRLPLSRNEKGQAEKAQALKKCIARARRDYATRGGWQWKCVPFDCWWLEVGSGAESLKVGLRSTWFWNLVDLSLSTKRSNEKSDSTPTLTPTPSISILYDGTRGFWTWIFMTSKSPKGIPSF